jgi:hypothetical protein
VPEVLGDLESSAEDTVDYALAHDRARVEAEARSLRSTANGPAAVALARAGVPAADVALLRARAGHVAELSRRGSYVSIALAANAVSQLMPRLYGRFRSSVPALVLRLDYFDREAQLRALAGQGGLVESAIDGLRRAWPRVRPKVIAAGGAAEAAAFDRHVAAMARLRAGDRRAVEAEAVRGLELVDDLERVFG